jgi:hypothetical protein
MSHHKKDGLVSKVQNIPLLEDEDGLYIIYCHFNRHRGVALLPQTCELRDCRHKERFYVERYNFNQTIKINQY